MNDYLDRDGSRTLIPFHSIGGGIGQSRTHMLPLRKAHLGEVSVTVWPDILKEMCRKRNRPRMRTPLLSFSI